MTRRLLIILSFISLGTVTWSIWWLKPALLDGTRYAFMMIHKGSPFFDNRISHAIFQIPAVFWGKFDSEATPLILARIYLFTLITTVLLVLIYRIIKAKSVFEWYLPSVFLFLGILPGISYAVSSVFETAFFFLLMQESLTTKPSRWKVFLFSILVAFGHPALIIGFLATLVLLFLDKRFTNARIRSGEMLLIASLIPFQIYSIIDTARKIPGVPESWGKIAFDYILQSLEPRMAAVSMMMTFMLLTLTDIISFRQKKLVQLSLFVALVIFFFRVPTFHAIQGYAYFYRVFTVGVVLVLSFHLWMKKWKDVNPSIITLCALVFVSGCFVFWDFRMSQFQKTVFDFTKSIKVENSCKEVSPPNDMRHYYLLNLTTFKILADNRWDIDYLVVDAVAHEGCAGPKKAGMNTVMYPAGFNIWHWFGINGKFKLSKRLISTIEENTLAPSPGNRYKDNNP